jgi:hypothetical protein
MNKETWFRGNPADEKGVMNHQPEQLEGVELTAQQLVEKYLSNVSSGAIDRGIADGGLVKKAVDQLRSQDIFLSVSSNDPSIQRRREEKIQIFADQEEVSATLVSAILEQLNRQIH